MQCCRGCNMQHTATPESRSTRLRHGMTLGGGRMGVCWPGTQSITQAGLSNGRSKMGNGISQSMAHRGRLTGPPNLQLQDWGRGRVPHHP